jgi:superfamily II DNA or RNA helicase
MTPQVADARYNSLSLQPPHTPFGAMTMSASIQVNGAFAELHGGTTDTLEECLSFLSPARRFSKAFKQGHWDGRIRLYRGRSFHAGLTPRVQAHLEKKGVSVVISGWRETRPVDMENFSAEYLAPAIPELWPHQDEAVRALLANKRGVIKSPTGSGKTAIIAAVARYLWEERDWRSLIVVPKKGLLHQTAQELERMFDGDIEVGVLGDSIRKPGPITVGTAQTLIGFKPRTRKRGGKTERIPADPTIREVVRNYETLFLDETHRASSDSWQDISLASGAVRRYGLSGTPQKGDEIADLKMEGATGPTLLDVSAETLIEAKLASKPKIAVVMSDAASGAKLDKATPYKEAYETGVVDNDDHNLAVVRAVEWLIDHKRQTLVLCRRRKHFTNLSTLMESRGVEHHAVWGDTATEEREFAKKSLKAKKTPVVLATTIWDEGEDVPSIDAIVLAEGVKASTNAIQRVGRGMRKGGDFEVWIVDFAPTCHPVLMNHAAERCEAYEKEGYDVRIVNKWDNYGDGLNGMRLPFLSWEE